MRCAEYKRGEARFGQAGFTLAELLVVVVIIGILATIGFASMRQTPDTDATARATSNLMREASRNAAAAGSVPAEALALGETSLVRVQLFSTGASGNTQVLAIERFSDIGAGVFQWNVIQRYVIPSQIQIYGYRASAELSPGLGPDVVAASGPIIIPCDPRGACAASTFYIYEASNSSNPDKRRVVTMPLHGAPQIFRDW